MKILDEPIQTNGDILGTINHKTQQPSFDPFEVLLFTNDTQTNHSKYSRVLPTHYGKLIVGLSRSKSKGLKKFFLLYEHWRIPVICDVLLDRQVLYHDSTLKFSSPIMSL